MEVDTIKVDKWEARKLWKKYQAHKHYQAPIDESIEQAYRHIAQGRTIIQACASIRAAGLNEQRLPRLAIARADAERVYWSANWHEGVFNIDPRRRSNQARSRRVVVPWEELRGDTPNGHAMVPLVPVHMRPARGLENYHVLFEAVWTALPPGDPYLLRHLGGDLWLVLAAWDLTPVERAAMATRVNG